MVLWIIFVIEILDLDFETFHEMSDRVNDSNDPRLIRWGISDTVSLVPYRTEPDQTDQLIIISSK